MTQSEKDELIYNHVLSYLFEEYVTMMTGISLAEQNFEQAAVDSWLTPDNINKIAQYALSRMSENIAKKDNNTIVGNAYGGILFPQLNSNPNQFKGRKGNWKVQDSKLLTSVKQNLSSAANTLAAGKSLIDVNTAIKQIASSNSPEIIQHVLDVIETITNKPSILSNPAAIVRQALLPKKFDRIFNIVIDPDDFEIDYAATLAQRADNKSYGSFAIEQLALSGELEQIDTTNGSVQGYNGTQFSTNQYKLREKSKSEGDSSLDQFFFSIETFKGDSV